MEEAITRCLECNTPLSSTGTGGLCPKCLLKLGLASSGFGFTRQGLTFAGTQDQALEFGGYRIIRMLGRGGMGAVYEAEQKDSGRRVALKILSQTPDQPLARERFLREGRLAAAVRHPNVVGVIAAEEIEDTAVIAMELLHEGSLAERVETRGPLPVREAVDAALQILAGLEAAHAVGVLHRDVKPANCFISPEGVVKVGDFGLSITAGVQIDQALTQTGVIVGTPAFASPEQLRGEDLDLRSDLYSTGATLYHLLTGDLPYKADNFGAFVAEVMTGEIPDPRKNRKDVPRALAAVVMRCMARSRHQRYPDHASLRAALEPFGSDAPRPGLVGMRVAAHIADGLPGAILSAVLENQFGVSNSFSWIWLVPLLFGIIYFSVFEGIWGTTPGKLLCGLRVASAEGGLPGVPKALLRSLVFNLHNMAPPPYQFIGSVFFLMLVSTMRRRNGYAMLHDIVSGTRVVGVWQAEKHASLASQLTPPHPDGTLGEIGPFQIVRKHDHLVEAWDPVLGRSVWISPRDEGSPQLSLARQDVSRPGRLRWLQSRRCPEENWDAFEAPSGRSLVDLSESKRPWADIRAWMLDLAREKIAAQADPFPVPPLSFDHVWITSQRHAVLMDFPVPDGRGDVTDEPLGSFLPRMSRACMAENPPLHANALLEEIAAGSNDPVEVAAKIRESLRYPAAISLRRRLLSILLWPLLALANAVLVTVSLPILEDEGFREALNSPGLSVALENPNSLTEEQRKTAAEFASLDTLSLGMVRSLLGVLVLMLMLGMGAVGSLIWSAAAGTPPVFQLLGMALTKTDGTPAPRWRVILRTLLGLSAPAPLFVSVACLLYVALEPGADYFWAAVIGGGAGLLPLLFAVHAMRHPVRSLADRIAGTVVVAR